MEEESTNLAKDVKQIKEILVEQPKKKKQKKFKIPAKAKVKGKRARDNYVTVLKINDNGIYTFDRKKIKEETITVDGVPRIATVEHIGYYKKNPMIIQPSWSTEPVSVSMLKQKAEERGTGKTGMRLLLNAIELGAVKDKKKMSGKVIIGIILVIIVLVYLLFFS